MAADSTKWSGPTAPRIQLSLPWVEKPARSSLQDAVQACRGRGASPHEVWVASPFFDADDETSRVTAAICKLMARGRQRKLCFSVPAIRDENAAAVPRLAAPRALVLTPPVYNGNVTVEMLPELDRDKNRRPWHAKMLALLQTNTRH